MKPRKSDKQADVFQTPLTKIIDMSHPLVRLSHEIDWGHLEQQVDVIYTTTTGHPPLPTRLLAGLHYLKYTFNESDESVVSRWLENPYWQYFCGYEYLQHILPLHPSSLVRWRARMGDRLESLLSQTISLAQRLKVMDRRELDHVNVDTTVQEKAIAFPTDARLYHKMRVCLVSHATQRGIALRQSYRRVGKRALFMQGRYARARQMKRAARQTRKLRTYLGRVIRDIDRKVANKDTQLMHLLARATRLYHQKRKDKDKIYSVHESDVYCIAKGKAHKRYEFGNKVSIVTTSKNNWIVSAMSLSNPYDGHTLSSALSQVEKLTKIVPRNAYCDLGYRGHGYEGEATVRLVGKIPKRASRAAKRWMKRRAAIEPTIGHLKSDHRLARNYLKGKAGNQANAVLAAAAYNFAKLLAWFYCAQNSRRLFLQIRLKMGLVFTQ